MIVNIDTKIRKIGLLLLLVAVIGTLSFIFINSALPPEKSEVISNSVGNAVGNIVNTETPTGSFIRLNLRKIAHFTEYGLLGMELAAFVLLFVTGNKNKIKFALLLLCAPFAVGFIDESIQLLSGRTASVKDVWIDVGGFMCFYALSIAVGALAFWIAAKFKSKKQQN